MSYQRRQSETIDVLRLLTGIVFLCSAVFRMFHHADGVAEMTRLHLPTWLSGAVIVFDLAVAAMFVLDVRVRTGAALTIAFLSLAMSIALWFNWREIVGRLNEIFVFTPNSVGMWIQFMYILVLILLYREADKWS